MVEDPRARPVIDHFFDNFLPIAGLAGLERSPNLFPTFNPQVGQLLRQETLTFMGDLIFDQNGTWPQAFTADYTFMNETLAAFYGVPGAVTGEQFQRVPLDTTKRLGFLLQAGVMAGTVHTNETNPVKRGAYVLNHLMCKGIPLPPQEVLDQAMAPEEYEGATARERFTQHSADGACAGCHKLIDPVGFALENFDPVGLWRDEEDGALIDATGQLPGAEGTLAGPVALAQALSTSADANACFVHSWANYGYGLTMGNDETCAENALNEAFTASGFNIKQLLLALTQSDQFNYLPAQR
jgi:hypothetical protein